jgi:hypothetical protein
MNPQITPTQIRAAVGATLAVAEAIRELGRVPAGEFYARICGSVDLPTFTKILDILKGAGVLEERAHELIWTGPAKEGAA